MTHRRWWLESNPEWIEKHPELSDDWKSNPIVGPVLVRKIASDLANLRHSSRIQKSRHYAHRYFNVTAWASTEQDFGDTEHDVAANAEQDAAEWEDVEGKEPKVTGKGNIHKLEVTDWKLALMAKERNDYRRRAKLINEGPAEELTPEDRDIATNRFLAVLEEVQEVQIAGVDMHASFIVRGTKDAWDITVGQTAMLLAGKLDMYDLNIADMFVANQ
ncbi:hypothetical protein HK101_005078, partial [Irineochytrium annulatum]